jgi:hypothetical protein
LRRKRSVRSETRRPRFSGLDSLQRDPDVEERGGDERGGETDGEHAAYLPRGAV